MSRIPILQCPECLIGAIWVEKGTKPDEIVDCSNCHERFVLEALKKRLKKHP